MAIKLHIKKGDTVIVISGENKGRQGRVIKVLPEQNKAIVEGVNIVSRHKKQPDAQNPDGGIVKQEAPVHISNLMLLEGENAVRVGRKLEDGKLVRYSKKTGEVIK